ncbi:ABC transporter [Giardia muris]|uniref:ABC transporter n=1 Tax=Giardia muris TaxID=5742 RepID=A0A4Z1TB48_GIAMU|nr:ABC transporter [Giardia muris]|eukprot:TNJ29759.1 ABC transporter [Giardia muris]
MSECANRPSGRPVISAAIWMELPALTLVLLFWFLIQALSLAYNLTYAVSLTLFINTAPLLKVRHLARVPLTMEYCSDIFPRFLASMVVTLFKWMHKELIVETQRREKQEHPAAEALGPFGPNQRMDICGLEHTLLHLFLQYGKLLTAYFVYRILRLILMRLIYACMVRLRRRLKDSLLSLTLYLYLAQPIMDLTKAKADALSGQLETDVSAAVRAVGKFLETSCPPIFKALLVGILFLWKRRRPQGIGPTSELQPTFLRGNSFTSILFLIVIIPLPLKVIISGVLERSMGNRGEAERKHHTKLLAYLAEIILRSKSVKLFDTYDYEIATFIEQAGRRDIQTERVFKLSTATRIVDILIGQYYTVTCKGGTLIFILLGVMSPKEAQIFQYFTRELYTQVGNLTKFFANAMETKGKLLSLYEHIELPQEQGTYFYGGSSYLVARNFIKEQRARLKPISGQGYENPIKLLKDIPSFLLLTKRKKMMTQNDSLMSFERAQWSLARDRMDAELALRRDVLSLIPQSPHEETSTFIPNHSIKPIEIEFKNVSFSYPKKPPTLTGINLKIKPGERIAIVGASGIGKSTLINILARLFCPTDEAGIQGTIYFNGEDIGKLPLQEVRARVSILSQDSFVFPGTAATNILYGHHISLLGLSPEKQRAYQAELIERTYRAARIACADSFIGPQVLTETLDELSGGQQQRLCLARVLARRGSILILDEATSALDKKTEGELLANVSHALEPTQTLIVIAHKSSAIRAVNRIYVLANPDEKGARIVESGTYEELLARGWYFRDLIAARDDVND